MHFARNTEMEREIMIFICYPKCTTCQKARKWLDEHQVAYELRDIKLENPTYDELAAWYKRRVCRCGSFSIPAGFFISLWS